MKYQYIDNTSGSVTFAASANVNRVLNFKNSQSLVGSKTLGAQVLRNEVVLTTPVTISVKPEGCDDSCSATILQATRSVRITMSGPMSAPADVLADLREAVAIVEYSIANNGLLNGFKPPIGETFESVVISESK